MEAYSDSLPYSDFLLFLLVAWPLAHLDSLTAMADYYKMLLDSGEFSDFQIRVGNRTFHVHRAIICPHSKVLHALCTKVRPSVTSGKCI
jgi:BTB/POZ domain